MLSDISDISRQKQKTTNANTARLLLLSQQRQKKRKRRGSSLLRPQVPMLENNSNYAWSQSEFNKYLYFAVKALRKNPEDKSYVLIPMTTNSNRKRSFGTFTCFMCDNDCERTERIQAWERPPPPLNFATVDSSKKKAGKDIFLTQFLGTCHLNRDYPGAAFKILLVRFLIRECGYHQISDANASAIFKEDNTVLLKQKNVSKFSMSDFTDDIDKTGKTWFKNLRSYVSQDEENNDKRRRFYDICNGVQFLAEDKTTFEPITFSDKKSMVMSMITRFTHSHWCFLKLCRAIYNQKRNEGANVNAKEIIKEVKQVFDSHPNNLPYIEDLIRTELNKVGG